MNPDSSRSVKPGLTPKRVREPEEYFGFLRRMIAAFGRRIADADPEDLAFLISLRDEVENAIGTAVRGQRKNHGTSWAEIGRGVGVTRQAAQMRYGKTD
jgi:hypothetical protein